MRQAELLQLIVDTLENLAIPYAIVGSFASSAWGEPRMTRDIDVVVSLSATDVGRLCEMFPSDQFYLSRSAAEEAVANRGQFNVIHPSSGNKVDFMVADDSEWSRQQLLRRQSFALSTTTHGFVAAPDDVILGKLLCYREGRSDKHLRDIAGILKISGELVDRDYVEKFAGDFGVADIWHAIVARVDGD